MLVRTRSVGVAFYARADQERALVSPFMLVRIRSVVPCSFSSCRQRAFGAVLQFQLVQTRSFVVAFYARADQEHWCRLLCSCGSGALCHAVLGSCRR
ncbi:hypothetical protein ACFX13_041862 [Malus domestica]